MDLSSKDSDKVDTLMGLMTLTEKIGQLNLMAAGEGLLTGARQPTSLAERLADGQVGAIFGTKSLATARAMQERALAGSRLGIPLFFAEDVIHGHRTVFPLNIGLACSWDMDLIAATSAFAAAEAAAEGLHQVYAPMIDISRDARWGRVAEGPGEDPLLAARIATAAVRGFQGNDPGGKGRVAACLKHFVAYGAPDSGRDYDNASLAWEDLLTIYLPPFAAGVAAGAASVMVAFNAVNKLPMHANAPLIEGWLRAGTGFDGLVVSDYTGVAELTAHGLGRAPVAVARALHAGVDMDMVGEDYLRELPGLAETGVAAPDAGIALSAVEITALIDRACRRVLRFKQKLGLLEDPFRRMERAARPPARAKGRALARKAAARAAVLLKNDGLLPLSPKARVALIGPFAADRANMLGTWAVSGRADDVTPLHEAVAALTGRLPALAWGANIVDESWLVERLNVHGVTVQQDPRPEAEILAEALAAAAAAEVIVAAVGEAKEHAGESSSRLSPDLPAPQQRLVAALAQTGKPLVVVVFAGRPLALGAVAEQADALLYAWHGGVAGPEGVADLLFGAAIPSGRLAVTLPAHPGEVPSTYAAEPTGRPSPGRFAKFRTGWLDLPDDAPRFPFGFGLNFGDVLYGPPRLSRSRARAGQTVTLQIEITNTSARAAIETVQLYASDPVARITRPRRWLIDFRQVPLGPGESRVLRFRVTADQFSYPLAPSLQDAEWVRDPGEIHLHIGANSRDTQRTELTWMD
ncbi:glycoside hydrolase family 3 N-terminal domain-containing protein [Paracoccus sp. S1E-3]|uniref:glycoside hydrolase family 3 N-terminal domain-containing protein n=1 Tax=Paracoccus sp. S1E-3 TaxID=2756130 RepID=UPI0015EF4965|nr:glycoside hydrolase family 3 N-terminal domain-containing protein [Paracoccus sp. S1E-3]MBA4491919.1 glycoside hydrolase family 3 C-terminal domain-containing protein [Paracoccus sp. S1E-3]